MNADHYFTIGSDHDVCEDYALSIAGDTSAFIALCDGCSSSPDVDFGARALALSAKRTLSVGGGDMIADLFGKVTIHNLGNLHEKLPIHPHSLDATLLVAFVKENNFKSHIFGDGVFFHKTHTTLRIIHVDFEPNSDGKSCPAYLSYYLDELRKKDYETIATGSKHILDILFYIGDKGSIEKEDYVKPFVPVTFDGTVNKGDIIGIMSDGVNSFRHSDNSEIPWVEMVKSFVDFKTTSGVFVQRRLSSLKRQYVKEHTSHYDDISMASIVI